MQTGRSWRDSKSSPCAAIDQFRSVDEALRLVDGEPELVNIGGAEVLRAADERNPHAMTFLVLERISG